MAGLGMGRFEPGKGEERPGKAAAPDPERAREQGDLLSRLPTLQVPGGSQIAAPAAAAVV